MGELVDELGGALLGDGGRCLRTVRTGIEVVDHGHDRDACDLIAGEDGALDGSGTAPARQQRRMHVDAALRGDIEHGVGQDGAVGGDRDQVGGELAHGGDLVGRDAGALAHGDAQLLGTHLDRRRLEGAAARAHGIGTGEDGDDLVV